MLNAFFARLHMPVENRGIRADAQFVCRAVHFHPSVGTQFALEDLIMHAVVKNLRAAAGHRSESRLFERHQHLARRQAGDLREMIDLDGRQGLQVQLGEALARRCEASTNTTPEAATDATRRQCAPRCPRGRRFAGNAEDILMGNS